jgi:hypothetical protein
MLGQRYKELDTELALARHRVAELLDAWEVAHRGHTVIKAANQVEFARQYNASVGSIVTPSAPAWRLRGMTLRLSCNR